MGKLYTMDIGLIFILILLTKDFGHFWYVNTIDYGLQIGN